MIQLAWRFLHNRGEWWKVAAERTANQIEEMGRVDADNAKRAKDREDAENRESRERAAAMRRGPQQQLHAPERVSSAAEVMQRLISPASSARFTHLARRAQLAGGAEMKQQLAAKIMKS